MPANSSLDVNEEWAIHCSCRHDKLLCPAHSVDITIDKGDANEINTEEETSHPFKLLRDFSKFTWPVT